MSKISSQYYLFILVSQLMIVVTSTTAYAKNFNHMDRYQLDSYQSKSVSTFYLTKNHQNSEKREYTFKAPDNSSTLIDTAQSSTIRGYKVEVYGSDEELLRQVRAIEPRAFIKGHIIQVGIFSEQDNAEDLVRKLAVAGYWARIIPE